jgi:glutamate dehydrogenase (NAD(P)+)
VQNNENEQWDESEVNEKLHKKMVRATDAVIDKQREINESLDGLEAQRGKNGRQEDPLEPVDLRTSAFVLAVERVAQVTLERGIWP